MTFRKLQQHSGSLPERFSEGHRLCVLSATPKAELLHSIHVFSERDFSVDATAQNYLAVGGIGGRALHGNAVARPLSHAGGLKTGAVRVLRKAGEPLSCVSVYRARSMTPEMALRKSAQNFARWQSLRKSANGSL